MWTNSNWGAFLKGGAYNVKANIVTGKWDRVRRAQSRTASWHATPNPKVGNVQHEGIRCRHTWRKLVALTGFDGSWQSRAVNLLA